MKQPPLDIVNALYSEYFERGVRHFLPLCKVRAVGAATANPPVFTFCTNPDGRLEVRWGGVAYSVHYEDRAVSENEILLVAAVSNVLAARHRILFDAKAGVTPFSLFSGLPEDHYVSAYLDAVPYLEASAAAARDRISDAIEVLRFTSLTTYESHRVSTGVLLLGSEARRCPPGAVPYTSDLASIKSFHRLSDGLRTVFAVNPDGMLVDLVDIADFSRSYAGERLPVPSSVTYEAHARATLQGGNLCLVLTPNGEMKVWAQGAQQFNFLDGRWRLTEAVAQYRQWERAVGDARLAELLFTAALNLAEARRGGMFVVLEERGVARQFVSPADLVFDGEPSHGRKDQIQYLLRGQRALDLAPAILETIARLDGAIVFDRESNLLAFGAILRHDLTLVSETEIVDGSRTTAALESSRFGSVLKISEDGLVSFYKDRSKVWEI